MEFARTRVDGIPTFWTQSGDGPQAGLVFRVGRADESLARSGVTHLIEHLALYPLGVDARLHYNGQVGAATTTFLTAGSPEEIGRFLQAVCANLHGLPMERLKNEKQVLRTEAHGRRPAITDPLFVERYGAQTYGLVAFPEFGIAASQPTDLKEWAGRYFTRGNAALWVTGGPPPDGLRLDLPDGPAMPAPKPSIRELRTPAYLNAQADGVSSCAVVRRSVAASVYATVFHRRLQQELRHKQALAYSPAVSYAVRDQEIAHVLAVADGLPEVRSRLVAAFIREAERLETDPISEDELRGVTESLGRAVDTPRGAVRRVSAVALNELMGRPTDSVARWRENLASVSVADVHEAGREAMGSSLYVLPPTSSPHRIRFARLDGSSETVVTGRRVRSADYPLDRSHLVLGREGVSVVRDRRVRTVRYAACAALLTWPDGARQLIGRDATAIRIEPALWRLKEPARHLDSLVATDLTVTMPYRPGEEIPRPQTRRRTRAAGWIFLQPTVAVLVGLVPALALLILLARLAPKDGTIEGAILVPGLVAGICVGKIARSRLLMRAAQLGIGHR